MELLLANIEIVVGGAIAAVVGALGLLSLRKKGPPLPEAAESTPDSGKEAGGHGLPASAGHAPEDDQKAPIVEEPKLPADEPPTPSVAEKVPLDPTVEAESKARAQPIDARPSDVEALRVGLATTRGGFMRKLKALFSTPEIDDSLLTEMEDVLLTSDIGVHTAERILEKIKADVKSGALKDSSQIWSALRGEALSILKDPVPATKKDLGSPQVYLFVGVNGVGKTTTIGKLASKFKHDGKRILLAAGDTYRAAAALQLEAWGRRAECETIKGKDKSDPASVIFNAIERAKEEGFDIVLADTAGRLHTKTNLMEELKKVGRAAEKALGRPVDETFLVLDATNGQNAIQQAELFGDALDLTGIVLTKLDGTAKGGVILGIRQKHAIPVRYIGVGEKVNDLRPFHAESFVEALFSEG